MPGLDDLLVEKDKYDKELQLVIDNLSFVRSELDVIDNMKKTEGWKILEKKLKEELKNRIELLVKDDLRVKTLLDLLTVADTKTQSQALNEAISSFLPE